MTRPRLSPVQKLAYAFNPFGRSLCAAASTAYLMYFYTDVVLLGAGLVGLALTLGRVWDAVNDPIMGYVSDRTRSRWGRRRPWILAAALPYAGGFALLFRPPAFETQLALFAYLLAVTFVLDSFETAIEMPSAALGVEIETDYDARTRIFALRDFFVYGGMICGGFLPLLVAQFGDVRLGYARVTTMFAALAGATALSVAFVPEQPRVHDDRAAGFADFRRSFRQCLESRSFRILLLTFFVTTAGLGIGVGAGVYALIYWLEYTPADVGLMLPVHLGCCCLALPYWTWLSKRVGKVAAIRRFLLYESLVMAGLYFMWPWKPIVYLGTILSGIGTAGVVNVTSLLADVIDEDELRTGSQRTGAFLGFWTLASKGAAATGPIIVGAALSAAGYVATASQPPVVITTIRWLYAPSRAIVFLAAYLLFRRFELSRERHAEVQAALAARRAAAAGDAYRRDDNAAVAAAGEAAGSSGSIARS
jgi:GPH family glycoside/pentoside/hexuronide:cation symporter